MGITNYKVYTPFVYADIITDLAVKNYFCGEYTEKKLENLRAADLSCGTGNLLLIMLVKLIELSKKITGKYYFNSNWIRGYDIDEEALEIYKRDGKDILKRYNLQGEILVFNEDSLLSEKNIKYNVVIGNPPYLGEKNHQSIFRKLKESEFGKKYYEAKMDYFYFFIEKGIDILENKGILVYVTTNYWLKADGAGILRKKLRDEGHFTHIVDYNISIFKDAPGQHNMIFSWRKNQEIFEKEKIENENFIVDTEKEENKFSVKNKNLYDEKGNIILIDDKSRIFNRKLKEKSNYKLEDIVNINQGIVSGCDKAFITKTYEENFGKYLKPFYKNKDIFKYSCKKENDFWIYYIPRGRNTSEELKEIFFPYKDILEKRREVVKGTHKWYELSWGRDENIMSGEKILARQRCRTNYFAYHKGEFFGSADIYYLTLKNSSFNIFYILGYLNSEIFYEWYKNNGKSKGYNLEFYTTPLKEVPVYYPENKNEIEYIETLVKKQIEKYSDEAQNEINRYFENVFSVTA